MVTATELELEKGQFADKTPVVLNLTQIFIENARYLFHKYIFSFRIRMKSYLVTTFILYYIVVFGGIQ